MATAQSKYPMGAMEIGDSFFIEGKAPLGIYALFARFKPARFATRKSVSASGVSGVRIWRVK